MSHEFHCVFWTNFTFFTNIAILDTSIKLQVLMNYYWFGDSLKDAVSKPRLHSQLFPNMVLVEPNFPQDIIRGLRRYGHKRITNDTTLFTGK